MTLFDAPHDRTEGARVDPAARTGGAVYTPLAAGTRTRCDHCQRDTFTDPRPFMRTARVRVQHGQHDWRLCADHAQTYREQHP